MNYQSGIIFIVLIPQNSQAIAENQQSALVFLLIQLLVQKALNTHWQIGAGYEFADWGKSQLGRTAEQTVNHSLTLNHLYTNGVLFNLTYIA